MVEIPNTVVVERICGGAEAADPADDELPDKLDFGSARTPGCPCRYDLDPGEKRPRGRHRSAVCVTTCTALRRR